MKKKKMRVIKILICVILACAGALFGIGRVQFDSVAKQGQIVGCELETKYAFGSEFTMPEGQVSYDGEEIEAESKYLLFPSGKANEATKQTLSEEGQYEVVFTAKVGDVPVTAKKTFLVSRRLLAVNNEKSSAVLKDGKVQVSLVTDDTFTYNEAIDISKATKDTPLLTMEFKPNVIGTADATIVNVKFTDLYDANNYVIVKIKKTSVADGVTYLSAGAANQPSVGVENPDHPEKMKIFSNERFGAAIYHSMVGKPESSLDSQLKLYFDYEEKAFYADREVYSGGQNRIVTDLDSMEYYGDNLWDGFTTGEVKVSVYAESYQSTSCNFNILQLNGSGEFSGAGDMEAPTIEVQTGYEEGNLPVALVGKPYPLFEAWAVDKYDGKLEAQGEAFYRYYTDMPVNLTVKDGCFTPTEPGNYVLAYTATDASGNTATKCVKIQAKEGDGMSFTVQNPAKETETGKAIKLLSGIQAKDASGKVTYTVKVRQEGTEEVEEVTGKDATFIPMKDGNWEVIVEAKDYISTVSQIFTVKANHTSKPQVYDTVGVPNYYILGAKYELPTLMGYDFSSGTGEKKEMELFVKEGNGEEKAITDGLYTPEKVGKVQLCYRLTVDGETCEKIYPATIVDVGFTGDLNLAKFFVATKGSAKAIPSATNVTYETGENLTLDFVNFVQTKKFAYVYQVGAKNNYKKVNLYLTDTVNGKKVKFTFKRKGAASVFSINDGPEFALESSFTGKNRDFKLEYSNDTHKILASNILELEVKTYTDGSEFVGYSGNIAKLSVEVEGVTGASELVMNSINGHSLNNTRIDRFAPEILVDTKAGDRGIHDVLKLDGAFAYDTINPICNLTMEVLAPDGSYAVDTEGVKMDGQQDPGKTYEIALEQYGDYTMKYVAVDGNGKSTEYIYAVTTRDTSGPKITLKRHETEAKVGEKVKIATAETEDNFTKDCKVATYVFDPEGSRVTVEENTFTAKKKGSYRVKYMAFDESGNYTFTSYEVQVE